MLLYFTRISFYKKIIMNIYCIGKNYESHVKEMKSAVPSEPVLFIKPATALSDFIYPSFSDNIHYECELVVEISKQGKNISEAAANDYWNKITLGIDFTARDIQDKLKAKGLPWEKCKAFDGSACIGKWIEKSALQNIDNIEFELYKNNERVQHGFSAHMIFTINQLIADISKYFTLQHGDVLFTGTPEGVGPVSKGDVLKGILEGNELLECTIR